MRLIPPFGQESQGDDFEYVNANPVQGIAGSMVDRKAIEFPMREIVNAIKMSGVIPSNSDLTQLYQAIKTVGIAWSSKINYVNKCIVFGTDNTMYQWVQSSGPDISDANNITIGPKDPVFMENRDYWKRFDSFTKSDVQDLIDLLSVHAEEIDTLKLDTVSLKEMHTTADGIASTVEPGHVIVGEGLDITPTGVMSVLTDNQTIKKSANNVLYAEVPNKLTAVSPIRISNSAINIDIDNNTLILSDNKLSVNPAIINSDDDEKATINSVLLNELNTLRKLSIGRPVFHTSTTLPDDHVWIDGSFVSFEDRPEFASRYLDGAFDGMLLEWNASSTDISNNPGKFRKNAANPTGLFLPSNGALFMRLWNETVAEVTAGSRNEAGLPNITGTTGYDAQSEFGGAFYAGATIVGQAGSGGSRKNLTFDASKSNATYGNSTEVMPNSVNQPIIMYVGKSVALNDVFYNSGTQQLPVASGIDLGVMKVDNKQFTVDKFGTLHLNGYVPTTTDLTKEILTADGTYTVPHSGWYKITCIGGGGAGGSTPASSTSVTLSGYGGNQGKSTIFGTYVSAIGGSGGGGSTHQFYGSGGGGCGEVVEQYLFLTRGEEIAYTIGAGGIVNNSVQQNGQGPTGGKSNTTNSGSSQVYGTGALNAGNGTGTNFFGANNEAGGQGGFGAPSPYGYGAGGGGAGGNSVGKPSIGGSGGNAGSIYAEAGNNGAITNIVRNGGAGAPGAIIIETMSILQGSIDVSSTPTQETIVSNSVYTPETSSWYEITIIGGGGGGGCDPGNITSAISGGGGGQGEHKTIYKKLSPTKPLTISIGRGGVGSTLDTEAEDGFTTTVDIGGEIISAEGGKKGTRYIGGRGGGTGISSGLPGHNGNVNTYGDGNTIVNTVGGMGGGSNAGYVTYTITESGETISKINATGYGSGGGGGWGGNSSNPLRSGGSNGCQGAVIIKKLISGGGSGTAVDVNIATTEDAGIVKPDGKTITVDTDGTIKAKEIVTLETFTPDKIILSDTSLTSWTCPKSGWWKVTCIGGGGAGGSGMLRGGGGGAATAFGTISAVGGGGGGGAGITAATGLGGGGGGGAGDIVISVKYITSGQVTSIAIGLGGVIGTIDNTQPTGKNAGKNSIDRVNSYGGGVGGGSAGNGDPGSMTSSGSYVGGNGGNGASNGYGYGGGGGGCGGSANVARGSGGRGVDGGNHGTDGSTSHTDPSVPGGDGGSGAIILEYMSPASSGMESELLNEFNKLRKTSIGRLVYHTSTTLPDTDHVWADGKTFVKFSERPEFKQKFDNGCFDGMLMAWDADATTIEANRGKYRPDAEVPTGLWVPDVTNLFIEGWTSDSAHDAGSKTDAGLPNITGRMAGGYGSDRGRTGAFSGAWMDSNTAGLGNDFPGSSPNVNGWRIEFTAKNSNPIYGNSDTVQPNSTNIPMMIYLGRTTGDDVLYYNPETTGLIKAATPSDKGVVTVDNKTIAVDDNGQLFSRIIPPLLLGLEWTHDVSEIGYLNLSIDNGLLTRSDYKEGWDKISKLDPSMILDDTAWLAEKASKGWVNKYSSGDGNLTFRVPLWSKEYIATMTPGSVKQVGDTVIDEMRPITGVVGKVQSAAGVYGATKHTVVDWATTNAGPGTTCTIDSTLMGANYSGDVTHGPGAILYPHLRIKNYVDDRASIDPGNEVYVRHDHALLDTFFNPLTIMPGCLDMSIDHGLLSRATYANAWDKISKQAGTNLITDEEWLAEVAANGVCAKFSSGDGVRTFRVPYIKKMYVRAPGDELVSGSYQNDAFQGHLHFYGKAHERQGYENYANLLTTLNGYNDIPDVNKQQYTSDGLHGTPRVADETRPKTIVWIPWIKMFGSIANPESIAIESIVDDRVKLNSSFGFPDPDRRVTVPITVTGGAWTVPENGFGTIVITATAENQFGNINGGGLSQTTTAGGVGNWAASMLFKKGAILKASWNTPDVPSIYFTPAVSSNPTTPVPIVDEVPHYPLGRLLEKKVDVNSSFGFPSSTSIPITPTTSGMSYKAEQNGWLYAVGKASALNQIVTVNNGYMGNTATAGGAGDYAVSIAISAGQTGKIYWNTGNGVALSFVPAIDYNPSEPLELEPEATPDYSLSETYTGARWIDGKKIYRRGHQWNSSQTIPANTWTTIPIPKANIKTVISCNGMNAYRTVDSTAINSYSGSTILCGNGDPVDTNNLQIYPAGASVGLDTIIIEYTKVDENI